MSIEKHALSSWTGALLAGALVAMGGTAWGQEGKKANDKEAQKKEKKEPLVRGQATVVVTAEAEVLEQVHTRVGPETMEVHNATNVQEALALLPGVSFSTGARNELEIFVRGNDSRRVPVFIDGIPSYVPYDGVMDFARFSAFDLEEIQVAKAFSSVINGANTLGGAINLVTKRPTKTFEGNALVGVADGVSKKAAVNVGSAHDMFFVHAGGSLRDSGEFRMSSSFVPNELEGGDRRGNSDFRDSKVSAKVGFSPADNAEFVFGYLSQKGEKGQPTAADPRATARYWRWPTWDKDNIYFLSHIGIEQHGYLKVRAYHDTFYNVMDMYDRAFSQRTGTSIYDDFTNGASLELGTTYFRNHSMRAVVQWKVDAHRSDDGTNRWKRYKDQLTSVGAEDTVSINDGLNITLGLAMDSQKPLETGEYDTVGAQTFLQWQAGAFWKNAEKIQTYVTVAAKDRFPTLKDRFSQRFDSYVVNPDLRAEKSINYDIGIKASLTPWLAIEGAVFYADVTDLIQEMVVEDSKSQMQNIGKVRHSGVELSAHFKPTGWWETGIYYTYLHRENVSEPSVKLRSTPKNRITGFVKYSPVKQVYALASVECQDALWDSYSQRVGDDRVTVYEQLGGYTAVNLTVAYRPTEDVTIDCGFANAFDRNYQQSIGFPRPGRTWFANAKCKF